MTSRRDLELDVVIAACASIHAALAPARFAEGYDRVHRHALQMAAPSRRGSCGNPEAIPLAVRTEALATPTERVQVS